MDIKSREKINEGLKKVETRKDLDIFAGIEFAQLAKKNLALPVRLFHL